VREKCVEIQTNAMIVTSNVWTTTELFSTEPRGR
jgi:hypothetical protein